MRPIQILFAVFLCVALPSHNASAVVPNPGFNSLVIGHSFFKPFADGMTDYITAAGIAGHTQTVVFSGGATGAPLALWENATKGPQIRAILDGGDVELFGMTYHPDYPTSEGYENWIDYALAKNPTTRSSCRNQSRFILLPLTLSSAVSRLRSTHRPAPWSQ